MGPFSISRHPHPDTALPFSDSRYLFQVIGRLNRERLKQGLSHEVVARRAQLHRSVIEQAERGAIQRLPLTIPGTREPFEVVNVLRRVPASRLLAWSKAHRSVVSEAPLGKFKIARTGSYDNIIVVTRALAEALANARVTGTALVPLDKARLV